MCLHSHIETMIYYCNIAHSGFEIFIFKASETLTELNALFPQENEESIRAVLMESGGDAGLAASRLIQWDSE